MPKTRPEIIAGVLIIVIASPVLLPIKLTRLVPLIGSIITFQWDMDEYYFLSAWLKLESTQSTSSTSGSPETVPLVRKQVNWAVGRWYSAWFRSPGAFPAAMSIPITWSTTIITLYRLYKAESLTLPVATFYLLGLGLAIIHIPFGGKVFALLDSVKQGKSVSEVDVAGAKKKEDMDSIAALGTWLNMHGQRTALIDLPAAICYVIATVLASRSSL